MSERKVTTMLHATTMLGYSLVGNRKYRLHTDAGTLPTRANCSISDEVKALVGNRSWRCDEDGIRAIPVVITISNGSVTKIRKA